jgi:AGCS family alanine or glycine:cation symporter
MTLHAAFEILLFSFCLVLLLGSMWLTLKLRFVQVRLLPSLFKRLFSTRKEGHLLNAQNSVAPYKALFTAMSTTLGIGTIVAPVIAIALGGPGALPGFLLTAFFGSAATYAEVKLSVIYRKQSDSGKIMGGPMQYLKEILSKRAALLYAIFCLILMVVWSGAQSNQVAAILDSPLMGDFRIPKMITGLAVASLVVFLLVGGIKRIGDFSSKMVPVMFVLYLGASFWIFFSNFEKVPAIFNMIIDSMMTPYSMATGAIVGGAVSAVRWGIFKGIHVSEAGIGTQTFPHSMTEVEDPEAQGALAMLSTYTAGFLAFLSGCIALMTGTWEDGAHTLGIGMVAASFEMYFSSFGTAIIAISALLFGLGTILGNSFNGGECFGYLTKNHLSKYYFVGMALMVFIGALARVETLWAMTDIILGMMALLHMTALIIAVKQEKEIAIVETVELS